MEVNKSNKGVIILLVIIILILSILCVLFATGTISLKGSEYLNNNIVDDSNNESIKNDVEDNVTNNNYEENYNDYLKFVIDNKNNTDSCYNFIKDNYYSYEKSYVNIINNISINNNKYTFRFEKDLKNKKQKVYLNDNVVVDSALNQGLLVDVCNYGKYILYSTGWEGSPNYNIINIDGQIVMSFIGKNVNYSNGILNVEEINKNDISNINDNELVKYQLNMNSENLQKENVITEKFECELNGPGYDC